MKNFTLLIALFFSLIITAQDHPGKRPELLLGKEVTIIDLSDNYYSDLSKEKGYQRFYIDKKLYDTYKENSKRNTEYRALFNKTFTITNVEPATSKYLGNYHIITLESPDLVLYHEYFDDEPYYFKVKGGLEYPDDFYCDYIIEKADTDNGTTDYIIEPYDGLSLTKVKGKLNGYLLKASMIKATLDTANGVTFILENGATITRPSLTPLKSVTHTGSYEYTRQIELTKQELELLKSHKITHVQLGGLKEDISWGTQLIKDALPCLMTK